MENQQNSSASLPIFNDSGKGKVIVSNIVCYESKRRYTMLTDRYGFVHKCPLTIRKIKKTFKHCGLLQIGRGTMINLNYISKKAKFCIERIVLIIGKAFMVGYYYKRKFKKRVKKYKLKSWRAYQQRLLV